MEHLATQAALAAALGIGSALHCVGMCGGFSLLLVARGAGAARRLALFHAGRVASYAFLGALAGRAGDLFGSGGAAHRVVALLAGGGLLLLALQQVGVVARLLPVAAGRAWRDGAARLGLALRSLAATDAPVAPLLFGAANGWLPCGATAAALALGATAGGGAAGAATLALFGIATLPALVLFALAGRRLSDRARDRVRWVGAGVTFAVAAVTLWRGLAPATAGCHAG